MGVVYLPIKNEVLLAGDGVGDNHIGDHDAVDVGGQVVQVDLHVERGARLHYELVVNQNACKYF